MLKHMILLSVLTTIPLGCSTTNKIPPGLTKDLEPKLLRLEGKTDIDLLEWKKKADAQYKNCIDSRDALIKVVE